MTDFGSLFWSAVSVWVVIRATLSVKTARCLCRPSVNIGDALELMVRIAEREITSRPDLTIRYIIIIIII